MMKKIVIALCGLLFADVACAEDGVWHLFNDNTYRIQVTYKICAVFGPECSPPITSIIGAKDSAQGNELDVPVKALPSDPAPRLHVIEATNLDINAIKTLLSPNVNKTLLSPDDCQIRSGGSMTFLDHGLNNKYIGCYNSAFSP